MIISRPGGEPKMSKLLDRNRSVLVVIDVQERLYPSIHERERMLSRIDLLLTAASVMQVPVVLTEQYPRGLGRTIEEIRNALPDARPLEKMDFSCVPAAGFMETLSSLHRDQIVVTGIEAHICVTQTALDLASRGENVFVCAPGCQIQPEAVEPKRSDPRNRRVCGFRMAAPRRYR
jgi:nicotinamidase-related amidase